MVPSMASSSETQRQDKERKSPQRTPRAQRKNKRHEQPKQGSTTDHNISIRSPKHATAFLCLFLGVLGVLGVLGGANPSTARTEPNRWFLPWFPAAKTQRQDKERRSPRRTPRTLRKDKRRKQPTQKIHPLPQHLYPLAATRNCLPLPFFSVSSVVPIPPRLDLNRTDGSKHGFRQRKHNDRIKKGIHHRELREHRGKTRDTSNRNKIHH